MAGSPFVVAVLILAAAASRLIPHPPNVAPIAAMALFGGAHLADRRLALLVPVAAMVASDLIIGLHTLAPLVYASMALIACIGFWLRGRASVARVAVATLAGSVVFFLITNFGVWLWGTIYPHTPAGLATAYTAAIPFFRNTLIGDALYAAILFGGFALVQRSAMAARQTVPPRAI